MKKVMLPVAGGILAFLTLGGGGILATNLASATTATESKTTKVSIDSMLAISALDDYSLQLSPTSTGTLTTASGVVMVSTNNATGYTLYLGMDNDETNALVNTAKSDYTIPTLSGSTTPADFPNNKWGYSIDTPNSITSFLPLPTIGNTAILKTTTGPAATSNTDFTVGVKADTGVASGTYKNTVKFTAVTNEIPLPPGYYVHYDNNGGSGVPADEEHVVTSFDEEPDYTFTLTDLAPAQIPIKDGYTFGGWTTVATNQAAAYSPGSELYLTKDNPETTLYAIWVPNSEIGFNNSGITTMQAMSSSICTNASVGTTGRLQDTRDYKIYYVTKLADNRCWMTQNLATEMRTDKAFTPNDTNITANWTPERATVPNGKLSSSTWATSSDYTHPYAFNPGDDYYVTSGTTSKDPKTTSGDAHYATGASYTWTASKATNDSTSQTSTSTSSNDSICPKGWTLPSASFSPPDFGKMLYSQGIITSTTASGTPAYTADGFNLVRSDPVYWVRAGYVLSGSRGALGSAGYYWCSAAKNSSYASSAFFYSSDIYLLESYYRYAGLSVRCIALQSANPDPVNPDTPSNPSNNFTNTTNTTNNTYNTTNSGNGDGEQSTDGYAAPQGVVNSVTNNSPNWFLIICLGILSLGLIALIIFLIVRLRKQNRA